MKLEKLFNWYLDEFSAPVIPNGRASVSGIKLTGHEGDLFKVIAQARPLVKTFLNVTASTF